MLNVNVSPREMLVFFFLIFPLLPVGGQAVFQLGHLLLGCGTLAPRPTFPRRTGIEPVSLLGEG